MSKAKPKDKTTTAVVHVETGGKVAPAKSRQVAVKTAQSPPSPVSETMAMLQLVRDIALNPGVDVEKMKAVIGLQREIAADNSRAAFDAAMAQMQQHLPSIKQNGSIEIREKDASGGRGGRVLQSTKFAKWDDINAAIKPILGEYGFSLRFRTGLTSDGRVLVVGILSGHGHREESEFVLPHDSTGSKNAVQAIGSSTSYGKRYAACALLNITSNGEDDDGASSGDPVEKKVAEKPSEKTNDDFPGDRPTCISQQQMDNLIEAMDIAGVARKKFLEVYKIARLETLPSSEYEKAMKSLSDYKAREDAKAAK